MSDLEQELAGTMARIAEDAPPAAGLADAARRRHRVRRQRRVALGAVAAVVIGVGAVVAWTPGGDDRATDPADDPAPEGWQTIAREDVRAEVPADWRQVTCDEGSVPRWTPPSADPCSAWRGAAFFGGATFDAMMLPGVLVADDEGLAAGYVYAGNLVLDVGGIDHDLARRILASARVDGQPTVDGSTWVAFDRGALSYEVPAWWGVGEDADRSGYSVCAVPASDQEAPPPEQVDASHVVVRQVVGDRMVTVAAPTQAVAELVLATVEVIGRASGDAPCAPEDFTTGLLPGESSPGVGTPVEGGERPIDLPTNDWRPGDPALKARIAGNVTLSGDGCVVLADGPGSAASTYVVWPDGYTASTDGAGALTLRGPDGEVVARQGDRIEAGGGYGNERAGTHPCLPAGEQDIASVMSEVTVVP